MVACFSLDYMHLVCLGIMRKLLWTWIRGPLSVGCNRIRLGWRSAALISDVHVACNFARKPRSLKDLARWKATELRQFLSYTGPIVLKGIIDPEFYEHFLLLHTAIKILIDKELYREYNSYAYDLLLLFVQRAKVQFTECSLCHIMFMAFFICRAMLCVMVHLIHFF